MDAAEAASIFLSRRIVIGFDWLQIFEFNYQKSGLAMKKLYPFFPWRLELYKALSDFIYKSSKRIPSKGTRAIP